MYGKFCNPQGWRLWPRSTCCRPDPDEALTLKKWCPLRRTCQNKPSGVNSARKTCMMCYIQTMQKTCLCCCRGLASWYMCVFSLWDNPSVCTVHLCRVCVRAANCARKKEKKKDKSLNVTLLSTVTTLTTCDVSVCIIIAHWACAEQAPSPPRALRICMRCTREWACTDSLG